MAAPAAGRNPGGPGSASHQRALELLRGGDAARALPEIELAVALEPENPEILKDRGNAQKALGKLEAAVDSYRRALAVAPDYTAARYNLALTLRELNRPDEAEAQFRRIHAQEPRDVDALFNLADILSTQSRFDESARLYRTALLLAPDNPYLWLELGKVCARLPGQLEESASCLRRCIALKADLADAHYQLGTTRKALGAIEDAVDCYRRALALQPALPEAHNDLANILQDEGRFDEGIEHYRAAIRAAPEYMLAHGNLGNALARQGRLPEAIECYRRAMQLDPDFPDVHFNLGGVYGMQGARDMAIQCYETALRLNPDSAAARQELLFEMQQVCDWSRFDELAGLQRRGVPARPEQPVAPFCLLSIPSTPQEQLQCARHYAAHRAGAVARDRERLRFPSERKPKSRLRIGYLSADFREHPGAYLIPELIELHDRKRFEVFAYSYGPDDGSAIRSRLSRAFDRFVDLSLLPHADAAAVIHADGADILLDLTGYTTHSRPEILALRPAPIQVNFLGYPGTMGADFIDYVVADRFIAPPEHAGNFSEKLVHLPGSYQANDRKRSVADTPLRGELGLPEGAFVFCCLNQTSKILPRVFAIWMRLLKALPGAALWLVESQSRAVQNLRGEAQKLGVDPDRLLFAPRVPIARHRARLRAADLFLDTFPYNAHSTASDALWVGLPVVTCAGDTFASRVAGSLLTAVGMREMVTGSLEEYEALALRLARSPGELAALREKLSRNRTTAPLFDTPAFARHLEAAYDQMWSNYLAGDAPRAIEIQGP